MTVFLTVISGTLVFVVGQCVLKFVLEPVQSLRKTMAAIAHARIEHAQVTANPGLLPYERNNEVSCLLRQLSAQLHSDLNLVPAYSVVSRIFGLPSRDHILKASRSLIGLANSVFSANERASELNARRWEKACDILGIIIEEDDRWPTEAHTTPANL